MVQSRAVDATTGLMGWMGLMDGLADDGLTGGRADGL